MAVATDDGPAAAAGSALRATRGSAASLSSVAPDEMDGDWVLLPSWQPWPRAATADDRSSAPAPSRTLREGPLHVAAGSDASMLRGGRRSAYFVLNARGLYAFYSDHASADAVLFTETLEHVRTLGAPPVLELVSRLGARWRLEAPPGDAHGERTVLDWAEAIRALLRRTARLHRAPPLAPPPSPAQSPVPLGAAQPAERIASQLRAEFGDAAAGDAEARAPQARRAPVALPGLTLPSVDSFRCLTLDDLLESGVIPFACETLDDAGRPVAAPADDGADAVPPQPSPYVFFDDVSCELFEACARKSRKLVDIANYLFRRSQEPARVPVADIERAIEALGAELLQRTMVMHYHMAYYLLLAEPHPIRVCLVGVSAGPGAAADARHVWAAHFFLF